MKKTGKFRIITLIMAGVFFIFLNSCKKDDDSSIEDCDGNIYTTVKIGTQVWLAENLKTTRYNDNTSIPMVTDHNSWSSLISPAYCWYDNDETAYKNSYGALYNWYVINTGKICPEGWHVPGDEEWHTLALFLDADALFSNPESLTAGGKLKETGTIHWIDPNTGATNETNFTALPGGSRNYYGDGAFEYIGYIGTWWSATENDAVYAWGRGIHWDNTTLYRGSTSSKSRGGSVRCIKDN
jgi:uncharacterized protein (TIGR02145 family)